MFQGHNIILLVMALLPSIAYALIIYLNDVKGISYKKAISYFVGGILSVAIFKLYTSIFPNSHSLQFMDGGLFLKPTIVSWLMYAFIQVGFIEEFVKMTAGKLIGFIGDHSKHDSSSSLFSTMFYFGVVALGFAFIENMEYFSIYVKNPNVDMMELFAGRTTMAMVMHMLMGLMMGYFVALSRLKSGWSSVKYHLAGLGVATLIHGSYDFIVFALPEAQNGTLIVFLLIPMTISLVMVTIAGKSLLRNSQRYQAILRSRQRLFHTK